jgi:hypothetical protein
MSTNWVAQLHAYARPAPRRERCDLCGAPLPPRHAHLVEPATRRLHCACTACALLFARDVQGRYRRVPAWAQRLPDLALADEAWRALGVPIDVAFFFQSSADGCPVGVYPGAAGPVETTIAPDAWTRLGAAIPALAAFSPDVEALLVNRLHGARECWRMPIDRCYALVGLIRREWRGLSGGTEVWRAIDRWFEDLRSTEAAR